MGLLKSNGAFFNPGNFPSLKGSVCAKLVPEAAISAVLFTQADEARFWIKWLRQKQNCRIWSEANPQVYVETPLHQKNGLFGALYGLVESLVRTSSKPMKATTDTFGDHLISRFGPVNCPPSSCDLTPLDYFLWGYVKSFVYADKPQTLDHLEDNIRRVIADIRPANVGKSHRKLDVQIWTTSELAMAAVTKRVFPINRLWHELCDMLRRLAGTTAPGHHDCSIQNEKVSNHGSIPITIDCNVVAFIVFEEVRTNDSTSP
ncbi:uncharacterized protein TNCV_1835561 [Trichonephila clavipes]|nr:uncharacterized protein TNCV_1835561 [Trichonephila clavipes]